VPQLRTVFEEEMYSADGTPPEDYGFPKEEIGKQPKEKLVDLLASKKVAIDREDERVKEEAWQESLQTMMDSLKDKATDHKPPPEAADIESALANSLMPTMKSGSFMQAFPRAGHPETTGR